MNPTTTVYTIYIKLNDQNDISDPEEPGKNIITIIMQDKFYPS